MGRQQHACSIQFKNTAGLPRNRQVQILPRRPLYPVDVRLLFGLPLVTDHLQAIITVLSLVNPFMCAAIFVQIESGKSPRGTAVQCDKSGAGCPCHPYGRRAGGGESASSLWRVAGCVYGGRRRRAGLAGIRMLRGLFRLGGTNR
jgi:hypothetical protein